MTRIRAALAFLVAILLAVILPAPAQAQNVTMQADTQSTTQTSTQKGTEQTATQTNTVVQNGSNNTNTTNQTITQTSTVYTAPPPRSTPPPAPPAPRSGVVFKVDASRAGTLPVGTSNSAWSQNTNVTLVTQNCSGFRCIQAVQVSQTACGTNPQIIGCAFHTSDGTCIAQVRYQFSAEVKRAILEHETGHCLGLGHNDRDSTSIMQSYLDFNRLPPGPDSVDRANVRAIYA